ncbi:RB1-inducible coiled-coil protein 1 isoform X2 [Copidosoma floridanum]|uniref:RB1-inducible coiled-coil protein 1 isoform X2 n=1 Tax=Copidosoma floridanum TaxID=29053 RepID=UPI000C6F6EE7|nr:RB1-inducible coiled-coil protein 1 isoform X2 [Copidosoma floridanum]
MMLYIFHVDLGCTITVDINMTTKTVSELKERIEIETNVPPKNQILLMSGGETLHNEATVGSYSTGTTDSNPIFLFNAALIDSSTPPMPVINYMPADDNLDKRFTESQTLPVSLQTLNSRTDLANRCCTLSRDQLRACERLVHDQHLQQQGWAAVLANFDDVSKYFEDKVSHFQQYFGTYLEERQEYIEIVKNVSVDLQTLSEIPVLPALRAYAEGFQSPEEYQQKLAESAGSSSLSTLRQGDDSAISLFSWITSKGKVSLDQTVEECARILNQLDEATYQQSKNEALALIVQTKRQDKKEIQGLSERLFQLEQVVEQAKKAVSEQAELSQGFQQNMTRVNNLKDDSVLPDLCASHKNQLQVMHNTYKLICDYRRRCTKAKEELSASIHRHLKWVAEIENKMQESIEMLALLMGRVKRLRQFITALRQIHASPEMYMNAVAEVVRRRTFSEAFLAWAGNLAFQIMNIHSEEIQRRREFQNKFAGHFLVTLFPGLDDVPPPFATEAPASFDTGLPKLTVKDVEQMKQQLPNLASIVLMPDLNGITQFFSSKSLSGSGVSEVIKEKESISMVVDESLKEQEVARPLMLTDKGDFESETDTEEFEKISQAAMDSKQTSYDSTKQQQQQHQQLHHQENQQKQLEVGASQSTTSTSTNFSLLNSSSSLPLNELSQFPSFSTIEKTQLQHPQFLSPLTECDEYAPSTTPPGSLSPNYPPSSAANSCDGSHPKKQIRDSGSDRSSPSLGNVAVVTDFFGTEFYMDESLPSSLSEHSTDSQHHAFVSLLQEGLNSSREEVERLRSIIRAFGSITSESVQALRHELNKIREQTLNERAATSNITKQLDMMMKLQSLAVCEHEQDLTVDHELELGGLKSMLLKRDKHIEDVENSLREKESEAREQERLVVTMRQNYESSQSELKKYQDIYKERLEQQSQIEKAKVESSIAEKNALKNTIKQYEDKIKGLETQLAAAQLTYEKNLKEKCDKLHVEHRTEIETIRSRFKLMAASTMERSPSDSSLEKIERPDVIEIINHETILEQAKKDWQMEKEKAVCKITQDLQAAKEIIKKNEQYIGVLKLEKIAIIKDYQHLQSKAECFKNSEALINSLSMENAKLKSDLTTSCKLVSYRETLKERGSLMRQLSDDQMKMSQENLEVDEMKDAFQVSETKKVKLEKELSASVLVVSDSSSGRVDVATCTDEVSTSKHSSREKKSTPRGRATLATCNRGDIVAMVWDPLHENYIILQDSETKYFLNSDSLAALGLKVGRTDSVTWAFGEVVEKEFCKAKKAENRYKVSMEEKFYRVRVKPYKKKDKDKGGMKEEDKPSSSSKSTDHREG